VNSVIVIGLLALAGFLAGGAYTVWKGGTDNQDDQPKRPAGRPAAEQQGGPKWLAIALGLAAVLAVAGAAVRMF
jgi:uncharacterized membrane protein YebE (DUF533 family)